MPLIRPLPKRGGSPLVHGVEGPERRTIAVDEHRFGVAAVNRRIGLEKDAHEEVFRERLTGADHVNPSGMAISVDQPDSSRRVTALQGASQLESTVRPSSAIRPSASVPSGLVMK